MVDLHCHILPGLDDGPATMEESMAMAESAIADGITHLVATPHSSNEYSFDFARVRQLRDELQATIGDRLRLSSQSGESRIVAQGCPTLLHQPARFPAARIQRVFDPAFDGPDVAPNSACQCAAGDHPPGAQRHFALAPGALEKMGTAGLLCPGDRRRTYRRFRCRCAAECAAVDR